MSGARQELSIVCPFCPLHCDDLIVDQQGDINVTCLRAKRGFISALAPAGQPRAGNRSVSEAEIAQWVEQRLADSSPAQVITGGTDLKSARILQRLQSEGRIRLAIEASISAQVLATAFSRDGKVAATFGDVRQHADLLWVLGVSDDQAPRLLERITNPQRTPTVIRWPSGATAEQLAELNYRLRTTEQIRTTARTNATTGDNADETASPADVATNGVDVQSLAAAIVRSRYFAIVLGNRAMGDPTTDCSGSEAAAVTLIDLLWRRNRDARAVVVELDPAHTNRCVAAWSANRPLPSCDRPSDESLRQPEDVPLRIRIGDAASADSIPVALQVGGVDPGIERADHYVPAATVGVHRRGVIVRGDGTVTLPLDAPQPRDQPTPAQWLQSRLVAASSRS